MTSVSHIATNRTLISPRGCLAANGCDILPGIAIRMPHPLNSAGCPQAGNPGVSSPWAAICELRSPPAITGKHIYATSSIRQKRAVRRQHQRQKTWPPSPPASNARSPLQGWCLPGCGGSAYRRWLRSRRPCASPRTFTGLVRQPWVWGGPSVAGVRCGCGRVRGAGRPACRGSEPWALRQRR
jgi:hypothetical protein